MTPNLWNMSVNAIQTFQLLVTPRIADLMIANERCGRWYISSGRYHSSAYFKSTDGHYGNWSFSTRRLNLDLLKTIVKHGGYLVLMTEINLRAILVDSTRRGKRMPDALSKTVPIWCAVLNRARSEEDKWADVEFPTESVPIQEVSSIKARIPSFVRSLQVSSSQVWLTLGCWSYRSLHSRIAQKVLTTYFCYAFSPPGVQCFGRLLQYYLGDRLGCCSRWIQEI
jgi:hypothetical protein